MDIIQNAHDTVHTDSRTTDRRPSEKVVTLSGAVSLLICLYLAVWVPLGVAFEDDDTAAILCPSIAVVIFEMVNFIVVYEFYNEEDLYEKNLNMNCFRRWAIASFVGCIPTSVIMFIWTSSFGFLVVMAIIGVLASALKNLIVCIYMLILLCIRR